jgi:hypothetical protein
VKVDAMKCVTLKIRFVLSSLIILCFSFAFIVYANEGKKNSNNNSKKYERYGVSFKFPKGQNIIEKAVPLYGDKPSKEAGSILIKSDPSTSPVILISWLPSKERDYKFIAELMGVGIKARKQNHDIHVENIMRELKIKNHKILLQRFCTQGEEGILLNVIAGWFCDKTDRIIQIEAATPWENPTFVVHSTGNPIPDWPRLEKDPSFSAYKMIANSFNCHYEISAVLGQSENKFSSGEKWDIRVLSFENTDKRKWDVASINSQYAELNDPDLTFWRVEAELTPKKPGYLKSNWFELIYTTQDGKKKASNSVAHISGIMGNKAMMGSSTISFSKLNPIKLDLLFAGPKNADDVKFIQLKLQNLSIPLIHE